MFDFIDPNSDAFEALKQFCFRIGEGRMEDQTEGERHFKLLYHPTVPEAMLAVHYAAHEKTIYICDVVEGTTYRSLDDLPLVHSFPDSKCGRSIFPVVVEYLGATEMRYHYCHKEGDECIFEDVPREQYLRLELLFDEKNPIPWEKQ